MQYYKHPATTQKIPYIPIYLNFFFPAQKKMLQIVALEGQRESKVLTDSKREILRAKP
jgi:hypothetical protein